MKFNEKIALLRKQKGWTQEALAFKMGISRQSVSKWETGECEPDFDRLRALASMFEVSLDYLLKDDYEDNVDKEVSSEYNVYNSYHIERNSWLIVIVASICIFLGLFIFSFFLEPTYDTNHSGFLGFLEAWNVECTLIKLFMVISIGFTVIGVIKLIKGEEKKKLR